MAFSTSAAHRSLPANTSSPQKFGPVDATLGLGFGQLGSRGDITNPLALVSQKFKTRPPFKTTGTFAARQLFRGEDAAVFGGVVVDTPMRGLQLIAEYSGDDYDEERARGIANVLTPVNFGVSYRPAKFIELGGGFMQGHILAARISLRTNFKNPPRRAKLDPPLPGIRVRSPDERAGGVPAPTSRLYSTEIANPPDWTIYAPALASTAPDLKSPSASLSERLAASLSPAGYRIVSAEVKANALEVTIAPSATRPPIQCEEIWRQISESDLSGFESVSFLTFGDNAGRRCVKFLSLSGAPVRETPDPEMPLPTTTPGPGWWDDTEYKSRTADAVAAILKRQRLYMEAVKLEPREATIYFKNATYPSVARAIGRAARAMTQVLPPSIEMITLVLTTGNLNGARVAIPREMLEHAATGGVTPEEVLTASSFNAARPGLPRGSYKPKNRFPTISPIFAPAYRQNLFDPNDPLRFQVYWRGGLEIELFRGFLISGAYSADIYNNFDTITRESDSALPHVRSDVVKYLKDGASGLERLELTWMHQLAPSLYGRFTGGYLEDMYGGADAELLYRPFGKRWAAGIEIGHYFKRDFDRKFGFQDFETTSGHVSLYYESPYYGMNFNVHAGRYLAGDWGATFEVARRFESGAEVSAFATFTDVPFKVFGEGSFDKGISIRFPFDLVSLFSTQQVARITFRPLTRDGGARINVTHRLYEETRLVSYGETMRNWGDVLGRR
ncbi:MAG: YjbH domain-containing protein [Alphaproteobacteria bacterium]